MHVLSKQSILGTDVTVEPLDNILEYLCDRLKKGSTKTFIITPNPEIITKAYYDKDYQDKLNKADISLPDGVGVIIASRLLQKDITSRITGVDFIEELCKVSREKPIVMGFLGGRANVAERAVECLKTKYPWIQVAFIGQEWDESRIKNGEWRMENDKECIRQLSKKHATSKVQRAKVENTTKHSSTHTSQRSTPIDILFVAYGAPKQEHWIAEHLDHIPVKAAMGVGGAFDYISGDISRAPKLVRSVGFEWLYRLIRQPWRFKRQLSLLTFLLLTIKESLSKK